MFFSSGNTNIYKLMKSYLPYHKLIVDNINFIPHYISHDLNLYRENLFTKDQHCLGNGKYCALPRHDLGVSNGKEILLEDIRQKCIYLISNEKTKNDQANPLLYWNYMTKFYDECVTYKRFGAECSYETAEELGVSQEVRNECLMHSFKVGRFDNLMFNYYNLKIP